MARWLLIFLFVLLTGCPAHYDLAAIDAKTSVGQTHRDDGSVEQFVGESVNLHWEKKR